MGGRGRPSTASHHKVMWSVWESKVRGRGSPRCWSASHAQPSDSSGWSNAFSREISQTAPRIGQHRPVCVRGRSAPRTPTASQIWEAVCVRGRAPLIGSDRSHDKLWEAEAMRGRVRPKVRGCGRLCEAVLPWLALWSDQICLSQWEEHGLSRPHTASPISLKMSQNLTFDSNSTSDISYQMC